MIVGRALDPARLDSALGVVSKALNRLLATDSVAAAKLAALRGRTVLVQLLSPRAAIRIMVTDDGLALERGDETPADVRIDGRLSDFIAVARARRAGRTAPAGRIAIQGDLATVQQLQGVMSGLELDWEELLAQYVGDVAARRIGRVASRTLSWLSATGSTAERNTSEYLRYEIGLLPTREDVAEFGTEAMALSEDVERLSARVARLARKDRS